MDRCRRFTERFSEYIDGRLTAEARDELDRHLAGCASCARDFEGFRRAHEALCSLSVPVPGRPVLASVRARIRQEEQRRRALRWRWLPAPALAAAGLMAAFLLMRPAEQVPSGVAVLPPAPPASLPAVTVPAPAAAPQQPAVREQAAVLQARTPEAAAPRPAPVPAAQTARPVRPASPVTASLPKADLSRTAPVPVKMPAQAAPEAPAAREPRIVVVAYQPPANYCAHFTDPVSGEGIAEVSVNSTYAPDGTVRSARVVLHFPAAAKAAESNDEKSDRSFDSGDGRAWPLLLPGVI